MRSGLALAKKYEKFSKKIIIPLDERRWLAVQYDYKATKKVAAGTAVLPVPQPPYAGCPTIHTQLLLSRSAAVFSIINVEIQENI